MRAARSESKKLAEEIISDTDAAEQAKLEFVKRANRQKIQELANAQKTEIELGKEAEREADRLDAERIAAAKKVAKEEIAAKKEKAREATRFLAQEAKEQEKLNASQVASLKSLVQMSAAMVGLQSVSGVFTAMAHDMDKTSAYAMKTAEDLFKIRGALRELAALRGEMGTTGPTTAHVLGVQAQTLQTTEEVTAMESAALGIGELAIGVKENGKLEAGKSMTREDFDKALISAGKMATLEGGSADAYGALTGQIALQSDHELSPEEMQARLDRMFKIQQPGGFRNMTQAASQFADVNDLVMNKIVTAEQAMGLNSAFSVSSPGQAATMTQQFVRATLGNQVRARGMKINPELETEKTFEYMKDIGADKTHDPIQIGKAIAADFAEAQKADKDFDPYTYLQQKGFGNQDDRKVIMAFAGMTNTEKINKIEAAQNAPLQIGAAGQGVIDKRFDDRVRKDPFLLNRQAETLDKLADAKQGQKEEPYEIARRFAFAHMKHVGAMYGQYSEWQGVSPGWEQYYDTQALRSPEDNSYTALRRMTSYTLHHEAKRLGVKDSGESNVDYEKDLARRVQAAGGDLSGGAAKDLMNAAKTIDRAATKLEHALSPKGPPAPIQGRPNQPRLRP